MNDLHREDFFGLVLFDSRVESWKPVLVQATEENVAEAREFVKTLMERGCKSSLFILSTKTIQSDV